MATVLAVTSSLPRVADHFMVCSCIMVFSHAVTLHAVSVEDMKGEGEVLCMTSRSYQERHRLLVLHKESGVVIWDLR